MAATETEKTGQAGRETRGGGEGRGATRRGGGGVVGPEASEGPWFVVESDDPNLLEWYGQLDGERSEADRVTEIMSDLADRGGVIPILLWTPAIQSALFVLEFFNAAGDGERARLGIRDLRVIVVVSRSAPSIALRETSGFPEDTLRLVKEAVGQGLRLLRDPTLPVEGSAVVSRDRFRAFAEALRRALTSPAVVTPRAASSRSSGSDARVTARPEPGTSAGPASGDGGGGGCLLQ